MKKISSIPFGAVLMLLLTSCAFFSSREVTTGEASSKVTREYFARMLLNEEGMSFEAETFCAAI